MSRNVGSTTLSPLERGNLLLLSGAARAAFKFMCTEGDLSRAMASEFVNELLSSIDTKPSTDTDTDTTPVTQVAFDDDGNLMPGIVDPTLSPEQQAQQLAALLVIQGFSVDEATALAVAAIDRAIQSARISFAVNNPLIQDGRFVPDQSHDTALSQLNDELGVDPDPSGLYDDGAGDLGGDDDMTKVGWRDGVERIKLSAAEYAQRVAARVGGELGDLLQRGLKVATDVISYGDIKLLQDVQTDIRNYLDARAAKGGQSEAEIMVFGVLCAANETLFPTNVLDTLGGAGKGIKAASNVIQAGKNADELAAVVRIESRALATEAHLADVQALAQKNGLQLVTAAQGTRGAWNDALNGKLQPKTVYMLDNGHTYVTDALGRVSKAEGVLDLNKVDRNTYQQIVAGKLGGEGYDGGHLIATLFGGAGEKINLVPQLSSVNRGEFRVLEKEWVQAILDGKVVKVEVSPIYSGAGQVPDAVKVNYWVDGKVTQAVFPNKP